MSIYKLILRYIPNSTEAQQFGEWAFGQDYNAYQYPRIMDKWNERHESIPEIVDENTFVQYFPKLVEKWRQR